MSLRQISFKLHITQILFFISIFFAHQVYAEQVKFVYLRQIDPTIAQDMRYAGYHNFIGRPIKGYEAAECMLTQKAAMALADVQSAVKPLGLSVKVYDCYRPKAAVSDFFTWSKKPNDQKMKAEFYPRVNKKDFFRLGYICKMSGHTRGSTVDLTLIPLSSSQIPYRRGEKLVSCIAPFYARYQDNSIDMGTGFDCMDPYSSPFVKTINRKAFSNRMLLRNMMIKHGFIPNPTEWWHFTLRDEPYPHAYFNFPIAPR